MLRSTTKALYIDDSNIPGEQYLQTVVLQSDTDFVMNSGLFGNVNSLLSYNGRILFGARGYPDYTIMIGSDFVEAPNLIANNLIVLSNSLYFSPSSFTGLEDSANALLYSYNGILSLSFGNNVTFYQPTTFLNNVTFNGPTSFGNILANNSNASAEKVDCNQFQSNCINANNAHIMDVIANSIFTTSLDVIDVAEVGIASIGNLYANTLISNSFIAVCNVIGNYGNIYGNLQGNVISANNAFTNDCFLGEFDAEINSSSFYYGSPAKFVELTANCVYGSTNLACQNIEVENIQGNLFILEADDTQVHELTLNGPSYGNVGANVFTANSLFSNSFSVTRDVASNVCNISRIEATDTIVGNASFGNGYVQQANITNLLIGNANCNECYVSGEANIESLIANFGYFYEVTALSANSEHIQGNIVAANVINVASNIASFATITSSMITSNIISSNVANIQFLYSNDALISSLNATNANVQYTIIGNAISSSIASFENCNVKTSINGNVIESVSFLNDTNATLNNVTAQIANISVFSANLGSSNTANVNIMETQNLVSQYLAGKILTSDSINSTSFNVSYLLQSASIQTELFNANVLESVNANIGNENCGFLISNNFMSSPNVEFNSITSQVFDGLNLVSNLNCGNIIGNRLSSSSIDIDYLNVNIANVENSIVNNCFIGASVYTNANTNIFYFANNAYIDYLYSTSINCNTCQFQNFTSQYVNAETINIGTSNIGLDMTDNLISNIIVVLENANIGNIVGNIANVDFCNVIGSAVVASATLNDVTCSFYTGNVLSSNICNIYSTNANVFQADEMYCDSCNADIINANLVVNSEFSVPSITSSLCNINAFNIKANAITSLNDIVIQTDNLNFPVITVNGNIKASALCVLNDLTFPSLNTYYLNVAGLVDIPSQSSMITSGRLCAGSIESTSIKSDYVKTQSLTIKNDATCSETFTACSISDVTTINAGCLSTSTFYAAPIIYGNVYTNSTTISGPLAVTGLFNNPGNMGIIGGLTVTGATTSDIVSAINAGFSGDVTANYVTECTSLSTSSLSTSMVIGTDSINLGDDVTISENGISCVDAIINGNSFVSFYNNIPLQSYIATCIQQAVQNYKMSTSAITGNFSDMAEASTSLQIPVFYQSITNMQQEINSINSALQQLNTLQFECIVKPSTDANALFYVVGNSVSMYNGNTLPFTSLL